ncbi:DUF6121 family protein [Ruicaihuangia caeni]|uniref:Tripartite tricarboxylate transporter TctB family protein n=1 Tax=Ruicaihuangia caeni TaxID=3042517 RepID=A0AAW6T3X6_9MICO|nr:hypothetical protein [Klugiella sp. YN-L-19]MDI2098526.1 hypothetical protein [Klugiella sp. YN-L-19]
MDPYRRYAGFLAVFAVVLHVAIVVAAFGLISLYSGTDPISDPDVGRIVGPLMVGLSAVVLLVFLMINGMNTPADQQRLSVPFAFAMGIAAIAVYVLVGGLLTATGTGEPLAFVLFVGATLISPYAITVGLSAFVITVLYQWVLTLRIDRTGRPRWPWENPDDV